MRRRRLRHVWGPEASILKLRGRAEQVQTSRNLECTTSSSHALISRNECRLSPVTEQCVASQRCHINRPLGGREHPRPRQDAAWSWHECTSVVMYPSADRQQANCRHLTLVIPLLLCCSTTTAAPVVGLHQPLRPETRADLIVQSFNCPPCRVPLLPMCEPGVSRQLPSRACRRIQWRRRGRLSLR